MVSLVILADDFTGALDTGVQFSKRGVPTQVTTDIRINFRNLDDELDVLVIDTESRYLPPKEAYQCLAKIIDRIRQTGIPYLYKKVDSALRGNVSHELKAIYDAYPEGVSFIPAFPELDRTVKEGKLYIAGLPVSESVFGQDPYEPVQESDIVKRLKSEADLDARLVNRGELAKLRDVNLFDAETEADLVTIGRQLQETNRLKVTAGCAGFAKVLADLLFPNHHPQLAKLRHPLTVICGSVNPITQEQVFDIENKGGRVYSLTGQQLLEDGFWSTPSGKEVVKAYLEESSPDQVIVFETFSQTVQAGLNVYAQTHHIAKDAFRFCIGQSLGHLAKALLEQGAERTFLFTGGDTLYQSMQVLGVRSLKPLYEVSPGVVLSELDWQGRRLQVLTKSGGFGYRTLFDDLSKMVEKET